MKTLEEHELTENTLVIFTSDNGPVIDDGYKDDAVKKLGGHKAAGPWRGGKYSNFEGGTRVPWIARWPARIKPGTSEALVCQVDLPMTLAELTGVAKDIPAEATPDSFNVLPAVLGQSQQGREHLVEHARGLALRQGSWKYITANKGTKINKNTDTELGNDPKGLLYDLEEDPGEKKNLTGEHPDRAKAMAAFLQKIQQQGRSRP